MNRIIFGILALVAVAASAADQNWQAQAVSALHDGRVQDAIRYYHAALDVAPTNMLVRRDLMWLLWDQEDFAECAKQAEFILKATPDDFEAAEIAARSRHRLKDFDAALAHYRRALSIRPSQLGIQLDIVRIHESRKEYEQSYDALQHLLRQHSSPSEAWPILARLLEVRGEFLKAADAWAQAVEAYPEVIDYAYRRARALHFAGREAESLKAMAKLLESNPDHAASREFLVQMSVIDGDLSQAAKWLESQPWDHSARDVPGLLRLADLHERAGNPANAAAVLNQALELAPDHSEALTRKAEILQAMGRWDESIHLCDKVVELHPACLRAWIALANGYEGLGNHVEAVRAIESAWSLDPTSPSLVVRRAQLLYLAGRKEESRTLLEGWLSPNNNAESEVPVLLYHGLATSHRDPMLASRIHMTTSRFEEQLSGLKAAGYQTVSLDQLHQWRLGRQKLPQKPVIITFDDGRLDSFRQADPVLEKLGFRAVMFVAGVNADRNLVGYASWDELNSFKRGGRWDLQSHGDCASSAVLVNSEGLSGNFLANFQWLPDLGRMESPAEWEARLRGDYASIQKKLGDLAKVHATAHAWPEGNYGQQGYVNAPRAAALNLEVTRNGFTFGFHQGGSGVNARSRDPILLERLEPSPEWTAGEMEDQLKARSPTIRIVRELLQQSLWDRDLSAATRLLELLRRHEPARSSLLWDQARVAFLTGPAEEVVRLVKEYLASAPDLEPGRRADAYNLVAAAKRQAGDLAGAAREYERSLSADPNQPQAMLELAEVLEASHLYQRSLGICMDIYQLQPEFSKVLPVLARLYEALGEPGKALTWWLRAAEAYPEDPDYAFRAERARYAGGYHDVAIKKMDELLQHYPQHDETRRFLIDCALVRGDFDLALRLLKASPQRGKPNGIGLSLQIAQIHAQKGEYSEAQTELRYALEREPDNGEARLLLAECVRLGGRPQDAIPLFDSIVDENPASRRAWLGMADAWIEQGEPAKALDAIRKLRRHNPEDPYLVLRESECGSAAGTYQQTKSLLQEWLESNPGPVLPVLRYRGLTADSADPMLARPDNHTVGVFADHIKQLHAAGYRTVSLRDVVAWYRCEADLPTNALMITFDDGLLDALRLADPILASYGYQAVMFVDARNASLALPEYAAWDDLAEYQATGRWDLQSKGTLSATQVLRDEEGRTGRFLVSLQWNQSLGRLETADEWQSRVTGEHKSSVRQMEERLGVKPVAFAWPDGDYGQKGVPNFSEAIKLNPATARQHYELGFCEDAYGLNLRSGDTMRINRLRPRQDWSGDEVLKRIQDENPICRVTYQLLRHAAWQGQIHEGYRWLGELRHSGASPARLATAEALLRTMAGDAGHASALLAGEGLWDSHLRETRSLQTSIERQLRPSVGFSVDGWFDSDDRHTFAARFGGELNIARNTRLRLDGTVAEYHHDELGTISETAARLNCQQQLSAFHKIQAGMTGHLFEAPAEDLVGYEARWDASWSDTLRTGLGAEFQPGYTVEMLAADINYHRAVLDTIWTPAEKLKLRFVGRYWAYADDNDRIDLAAEAAYELPWIENLQAIYRLTLADTSLDRFTYYTPQQLIQNQVGLDYVWKPSDDISWRLRYLPGYGYEQGKGGRMVHAVHSDVLIRNFLSLEVRPSIDYQQTPTYQMFHFLLSLEKSF